MVQIYDDTETENGHRDEPNLASLFGAPDFSALIKTTVTNRSREYERKVASVLKAGVIASIDNKQFPDAAAFLKYGPGFARASGHFADSSERARGIIDMLSAPDNPAAMFVLAAIPLFGQLVRNHEPQVAEAATSWKQKRARRRMAAQTGQTPPKTKPLFSFKVFGKTIQVRVKRPKFSMLWQPFRIQTQDPNFLATEVFSDQKVITALNKLGVYPQAKSSSDANV